MVIMLRNSFDRNARFDQLAGLAKKAFKQRCKGFSVLDLSIYIIVLTILMIVGLSAYSSIQDSAKRATTRDELNTLAQACVQYQGDSLAGTLPTNLGALITGLTAAQSADGVAKTAYVAKSSWTSDSTTFTDGWGNIYVYNASTRTVSSSNNGGTVLVKSF